MHKVILEYDDLHYHPDVDCLEFAEKIIKKFPKIIINFFTVANYKNQSIYADLEWRDKLQTLIEKGNICIGIHGYSHSPLEFKSLNYTEAYYGILKAEEKLFNARLPFQKVFRGPQWGINQAVFQALIDLGYTHVYSHHDYKTLNDYFANQIKIVYYNWNLKDTYDKLENKQQNDILVIHGHTHNVCGNGIEESYNRLCEFIQTHQVEFLKLNEY